MACMSWMIASLDSGKVLTVLQCDQTQDDLVGSAYLDSSHGFEVTVEVILKTFLLQPAFITSI